MDGHEKKSPAPRQDRKRLQFAVLLCALVAFFIGLWFLFPLLSSEKLTTFVSDAGIAGPLVLIAYVVLSHIIAPLGGIPALVVGAASFGVPATMFYIYCAGLISAPINFFISRLLGRMWVEKLVGMRTMQKVDAIVLSAGMPLLVAGRLFGTALFEEISYAFGLTAMPFRTFFIITALVSILPHGAYAYLFRSSDFSSGFDVVIFLAVVLGIGALAAFLLSRFSVWRHNRKKD